MSVADWRERGRISCSKHVGEDRVDEYERVINAFLGFVDSVFTEAVIAEHKALLAVEGESK